MNKVIVGQEDELDGSDVADVNPKFYRYFIFPLMFDTVEKLEKKLRLHGYLKEKESLTFAWPPPSLVSYR